MASPPRDTSMGRGRDDGDGGLVIFAATGREEALGDSGVEGKALRVLFYTDTFFTWSISWGYFPGDPKRIALPYSWVVHLLLSCHSEYNLYFYR